MDNSQTENEFWQYFDELIESSSVVIDRPIGSTHPRIPDLIYPFDYGYLQDKVSTDQSGIDIWVGDNEDKILDALICTIDLNKMDIEIKLLIACSEVNFQTIIGFHNSGKMRAVLVRRFGGIEEHEFNIDPRISH